MGTEMIRFVSDYYAMFVFVNQLQKKKPHTQWIFNDGYDNNDNDVFWLKVFLILKYVDEGDRTDSDTQPSVSKHKPKN